jgi:hypothetical protein
MGWRDWLGGREGLVPDAFTGGKPTKQALFGDSLVEEQRINQSVVPGAVDDEMYSRMLGDISGQYGSSGEDIENLMGRIGFHESKSMPGSVQTGGGPGRGLFQFEKGAEQGGATAMNRLKRYFKDNDMNVPDWAQVGEEGVDASQLTPSQQKMMFLANTRYHPSASFRAEDIKDTSDWWSKYHWAGAEEDKDTRIASFESDMNYYQ